MMSWTPVNITTRGLWRVVGGLSVCRTCRADEGTGLWAEFSSSGPSEGGDSRGCCAFRGRTSHRVGEPGGTLAGIGREGRSQFCENPSWEGPLVNQN